MSSTDKLRAPCMGTVYGNSKTCPVGSMRSFSPGVTRHDRNWVDRPRAGDGRGVGKKTWLVVSCPSWKGQKTTGVQVRVESTARHAWTTMKGGNVASRDYRACVIYISSAFPQPSPRVVKMTRSVQGIPIVTGRRKRKVVCRQGAPTCIGSSQ